MEVQNEKDEDEKTGFFHQNKRPARQCLTGLVFKTISIYYDSVLKAFARPSISQPLLWHLL